MYRRLHTPGDLVTHASEDHEDRWLTFEATAKRLHAVPEP